MLNRKLYTSFIRSDESFETVQWTNLVCEQNIREVLNWTRPHLFWQLVVPKGTGIWKGSRNIYFVRVNSDCVVCFFDQQALYRDKVCEFSQTWNKNFSYPKHYYFKLQFYNSLMILFFINWMHQGFKKCISHFKH